MNNAVATETEGASSGANEFMELRIAGARVTKFHHLLNEMGLHEIVKSPTIIYCDSNVAINWVKTGKISTGNYHLDVDASASKMGKARMSSPWASTLET
jgi:hypothetical protein